METHSLTQISMSRGIVGRHLGPASWTFKASAGSKESAVFLPSYFTKGFVVDFSSFVVSCGRLAFSALLIVSISPQATAESVLKEMHAFSSPEWPTYPLTWKDRHPFLSSRTTKESLDKVRKSKLGRLDLVFFRIEEEIFP